MKSIPPGVLLDGILNNAAVGVLLLDMDTNILHIGHALCSLLGYEQHELIGQHSNILLHPEDQVPAQAALRALLKAENSSYTTERRYRHKNGSTVWIIASVSTLPWPREPGVPVYVTQITSIDRQKQAEAAAAEAHERWNFALEGSGQGVWDFDVAESTWFFSKTWKTMRGIPENEVVDGNDIDWLELIHPEDRDSVQKFVAQQNSGELQEIAFTYREKHRDGHWLWILARGRCIEWQPDGKPKRIIGTDTDISEIKQREHEFAKISRRLELALFASKVGVWETDLETMEVHWDKQSFELFGLEGMVNPVPSGTWESVLHPDDYDHATGHAADGTINRKDFAFDYRAVTPSGDIRYIRCRASYCSDEAASDKLIGVHWDVTSDFERTEALKRINVLAQERNRDLEAARANMEFVSLHDSLTGLFNRRGLDRALAEYSECPSAHAGLTLLHIDLDRFKQINDTKGHAAGDAVLMHIADLLRSSVGPDDLVARIGGDEFVVLLASKPSSDELNALNERILRRSSRPMMWEGYECRCSVSIGVATANGEADTRQLLVNADIALYRAKREGRNCAAYFTDALQAQITANKQCSDDILKGLERNEFVPYFQPLFDARTLDVVGVEALARWQHPERGLLRPESFLSVANDLNAMVSIDRNILEQAISHLAEWDAEGVIVPKVSVNVSARRLADEGLIDNLKSMAIKRGRFSFELLESTFLDDSDDALSFNIDAIKELGIDIDIDDFGSGHASIVGMLRLSPNRLKIDRQLVAPIVHSEQQRRLVRSMVEIGKSQNIEVCAEGVASAEHARILRDLGCDVLQGFYFARPMPAAEIVDFIRKSSWRKAS